MEDEEGLVFLYKSDQLILVAFMVSFSDFKKSWFQDTDLKIQKVKRRRFFLLEIGERLMGYFVTPAALSEFISMKIVFEKGFVNPKLAFDVWVSTLEELEKEV